MSNIIYYNGKLDKNKYKKSDKHPDMTGDVELPLDVCENIHQQYLQMKDNIHSKDDPKPKIALASWFILKKEPNPETGKQEKFLSVKASIHYDRKMDDDKYHSTKTSPSSRDAQNSSEDIDDLI